MDSDLLHRKIGRQPDHPAAGRIEIDRLSSRIGDADEIRGVVEQRHEHLAYILDALALADVANEGLPAAIWQNVRTHLDGHEGSILPLQRPFGFTHLPRHQQLGPDSFSRAASSGAMMSKMVFPTSSSRS